MIPDETTIYCSKCSVFNIGDDCCICKSCLNRLIDEWVDESDKLFERLDIDRLKEKLGGTNETKN